jgi:hypothetical protein
MQTSTQAPRATSKATTPHPAFAALSRALEQQAQTGQPVQIRATGSGVTVTPRGAAATPRRQHAAALLGGLTAIQQHAAEVQHRTGARP